MLKVVHDESTNKWYIELLYCPKRGSVDGQMVLAREELKVEADGSAFTMQAQTQAAISLVLSATTMARVQTNRHSPAELLRLNPSETTRRLAAVHSKSAFPILIFPQKNPFVFRPAAAEQDNFDPTVSVRKAIGHYPNFEKDYFDSALTTADTDKVVGGLAKFATEETGKFGYAPHVVQACAIWWRWMELDKRPPVALPALTPENIFDIKFDGAKSAGHPLAEHPDRSKELAHAASAAVLSTAISNLYKRHKDNPEITKEQLYNAFVRDVGLQIITPVVKPEIRTLKQVESKDARIIFVKTFLDYLIESLYGETNKLNFKSNIVGMSFTKGSCQTRLHQQLNPHHAFPAESPDLYLTMDIKTKDLRFNEHLLAVLVALRGEMTKLDHLTEAEKVAHGVLLDYLIDNHAVKVINWPGMARLVIGKLTSGSKFTGDDNTSHLSILVCLYCVEKAYKHRDPKYLRALEDGRYAHVASGDNLAIRVKDEAEGADFMAFLKEYGNPPKDDFRYTKSLYTKKNPDGSLPPAEEWGMEFLHRVYVKQTLIEGGKRILVLQHVRPAAEYIRKLRLSANSIQTPVEYIQKVLALMADTGGDPYTWKMLALVVKQVYEDYCITTYQLNGAVEAMEGNGKLMRHGITQRDLQAFIVNPLLFVSRCCKVEVGYNDNLQTWKRKPRITNTGALAR